MQSDVTRAHYDRLADKYDENWAYSPEFIRWMTAAILDRLPLSQGDLAMDLGCGTGLYSRGLAEYASAVVCADPSPAMLEQLPADKRLIPLHAGAETSPKDESRRRTTATTPSSSRRCSTTSPIRRRSSPV